MFLFGSFIFFNCSIFIIKPNITIKFQHKLRSLHGLINTIVKHVIKYDYSIIIRTIRLQQIQYLTSDVEVTSINFLAFLTEYYLFVRFFHSRPYGPMAQTLLLSDSQIRIGLISDRVSCRPNDFAIRINIFQILWTI